MSIVQVYVMVCDRCGDCDHHGAGESYDLLKAEMGRQGWIETSEGDVCPDCQEADCQEEEDEDEDSEP